MRRLAATVLVLCAIAAALAGGARALRLVRHAVPQTGATIGLPASWRAIDARQVLNPTTLARFERENPSLAPALEALASSGTTATFFAFDPDVRSAFATNLNVVQERLPAHVSSTVYGNAARQQIETLPGLVGAVAIEPASLPAGDSVRLRFKLRLRRNGTLVTVSIRQYAIVRGTTAYDFTFTTLPALAGRYASTFEASARSIRFG